MEKFTKLYEEYGPETFSVGELKEALVKSNDNNFAIVSVTNDEGQSITGNIVGLSHIRVDKNRYELVIECVNTPMRNYGDVSGTPLT